MTAGKVQQVRPSCASWPMARPPAHSSAALAAQRSLQGGVPTPRTAALTSSLAESPTITSSFGGTAHFSAMCSSEAGLGCRRAEEQRWAAGERDMAGPAGAVHAGSRCPGAAARPRGR